MFFHTPISRVPTHLPSFILDLLFLAPCHYQLFLFFCPPLFDSQIFTQQVFHLVENRIVPFQDMKYVHFNGQNLTVETYQQIMVRLLTTLWSSLRSDNHVSNSSVCFPGLVGRSGKKVFNSLESGNFGEGRRAWLRVIAFLTAIRQIMIYLRDRYGLDQDGCVFVVADHVGHGKPLYPQKEQARRINSTAWGRLKKCETDSLIGKVARTIKKWEIEFGSEDTILKVPEAQIRRKQSLSCKQETQTQWGFLAFIFWERSDLSFTEGSESFSYNFPQLVCGTVENQSIHFGSFFMWRCHLKQTKQWRWRRNNHECNMGVVWEGSMGPRHRVSWVLGLISNESLAPAWSTNEKRWGYGGLSNQPFSGNGPQNLSPRPGPDRKSTQGLSSAHHGWAHFRCRQVQPQSCEGAICRHQPTSPHSVLLYL